MLRPQNDLVLDMTTDLLNGSRGCNASSVNKTSAHEDSIKKSN